MKNNPRPCQAASLPRRNNVWVRSPLPARPGGHGAAKQQRRRSLPCPLSPALRCCFIYSSCAAAACDPPTASSCAFPASTSQKPRSSCRTPRPRPTDSGTRPSSSRTARRPASPSCASGTGTAKRAGGSGRRRKPSSWSDPSSPGALLTCSRLRHSMPGRRHHDPSATMARLTLGAGRGRKRTLFGAPRILCSAR